ncbi:MAG TPA: uracil-DNA glycosylase [Gammaproteobacteria bacterium]|nr:uracil-DNA glycosylase [Gammaproteobacteria bacterium]
MTMDAFNLNVIHPSWRECVDRGLTQMDSGYLDNLTKSSTWLPGPEKIFNAFSQPLDQVEYVLFGESPYPRRESANGYAFWDDAVGDLWSESGLDKKVNRATSLRNILKMLLVADGKLDAVRTGQQEIANIDKNEYVKTNQEFFHNFLKKGFLLLNASPVLQESQTPQKDAKAWLPFVKELLNCLLEKRPQVTFLLFGRIANEIDPLFAGRPVNKLYAEHPYNLTFITNPEVLSFFKQLNLLKNHSE